MAKATQVRSLKLLLHAGFFASGIATVLIGQVLPILMSKFTLNDQQTGNFFPAQFAGSLIGTILTGWFGRRNRFLTASTIGCLAMAGGIAMLNLGSYELCLAGFFINGIGVGLTLPSINMLILELNPERVTPALNILNFFWGLGAILSQPFVDTLSRGTSLYLPTLILSATLFAVGAMLSLMPRHLETTPEADADDEGAFDIPIWSNPIAWAIAAFNFIHVGFESGMGGWLKTYTGRIGEDAAMLIPPITLFYMFFVAGRGIAPVLFRVLDDNRMLIVSLMLILGGMVVLLKADTILMLSVGASLAGFGTSSVFPTNMSRFTKFFGPSASRRMTPFFICGTLGAAATTWIIGYVSNRFGNDLHAGMFVLLISVVLLLVIQSVLSIGSGQAGSWQRAAGSRQ